MEHHWRPHIPIETDALFTVVTYATNFRELEAEVATHISRGDTLVLMTDRHDVELGRRTQETVQQLRQQWQMLKQQADRKKSTAKNYEDKLDRFR